MQRLTNLNCSLTHWNSVQSSSELLISQQNLLPNLPFLEHLSGHRHRFPLSLQQYLEKMNIAFFVCFGSSSYTTEKLLSTRKQPTFPPSDQKRNNLPQKFMNQTALLPHILLDFKTRCICISAVGTMNKAQEDITCWLSCIYTTCNLLFNHLFPEDQKSALCLILSVFTASKSSVNKTFPSQWYRVRGSLWTSWAEMFLTVFSPCSSSISRPSIYPPAYPAPAATAPLF